MPQYSCGNETNKMTSLSTHTYSYSEVDNMEVESTNKDMNIFLLHIKKGNASK